MNYKEIKEKLSKQVSSVKYFNKQTFDIIMKDRETANKIYEEGGNVQEFYKNCETSKTKFYTENGGAYCQLLSILA